MLLLLKVVAFMSPDGFIGFWIELSLSLETVIKGIFTEIHALRQALLLPIIIPALMVQTFKGQVKSSRKWIHLAYLPDSLKQKKFYPKNSLTYPKKQFFKGKIFSDPPERTDFLQKEKNSLTYPKKNKFSKWKIIFIITEKKHNFPDKKFFIIS